MTFRSLLTLSFFFLSFYSFASGFIEGLQYSAWSFIAPANFPSFHRQIERAIEHYYVPFLFLSVPVTILLIWFHHPAMSRIAIIAAAAIQTYIVVSTIAIAVPIQRSLGEAYSQQMADKLIFYHTYLRLVPGLLHLAIVLFLLNQILRSSS